MQRPRLAVAVAALSFFAVGVAGTPPVGALSCAHSADSSPRAISSGAYLEFFDHFEFAVIGTVTEIETIRDGGPDDGSTIVSVDVAAVIGEDTAPTTIQVNSPGPRSMMLGYEFHSDTTYFIPIRPEVSQDEPRITGPCDPIVTIDAGAIAELRPLALDAGIPFSTPDDAPADPTAAPGPRDGADDSAAGTLTDAAAAAADADADDPDDPDDPDGPGLGTAMVVGAVSAAVLAVAAVAMRRRSSAVDS